MPKYREDIERLVTTGNEMVRNLETRSRNFGRPADSKADEGIPMEGEYQQWYTEACALIEQLLPERAEEFENLYEGNGTTWDKIQDHLGIRHWMRGERSHAVHLGTGETFTAVWTIIHRLENQVGIVAGTIRIFESSLFNLKKTVLSKIYTSQLDEAKDLIEQNHTRAAGVIAGVVLEKHLRQVADDHNIRIQKNNPTIGDLNDVLKEQGVIDTPSWREIQMGADIRNQCSHNKDEEPNQWQVGKLIRIAEEYTNRLK